MTAARWIVAAMFAIGGATAIIAAVTDARWFFGSPSQRALTGKIPRLAARIIYGALGAAILIMAFMIATASTAPE